MIVSADGAASLQVRSGGLGSPTDKALFATLRSLADVVLVGAGTMRAEGYGPARLSEEARARRRAWGLPSVPPIAVITRSCRLDWCARFFTEAEQRPLVVTVGSAAAADRARTAEVADVIIAGDDDVDLPRAVSALAERGHTNVLSEGGPGIAVQLAAAGLLDQVCLTVAPPLALELGHVLEADGYLFLGYRRR